MSYDDLSGEALYRKFIADACKLLDAGDVAYCYHKYQLNDLLDRYGDDLIVFYNENFNWWVCRLK